MNTIAIDIRNDGKNVTLGQEASTSTTYKGLVIGKGTNMSRDIMLDLGSNSVDTALANAIATMGWTEDVEAGNPGISVTASVNIPAFGAVAGGGWVAVGSNVTFTAYPETNCSVLSWANSATGEILQYGGNTFTLSNVQSSTIVSVSFESSDGIVHQNVLGAFSAGGSIGGSLIENLSS